MFALLNWNFFSHSVAGFPSTWNRRQRQWERERRSKEWSTEDKSIMWWEFTQNSLHLCLLCKCAGANMSVLLWFRENSQWDAYDVLGTLLTASFHIIIILLFFIYLIVFFRHSHSTHVIRHCITGLQIWTYLILMTTLKVGTKAIRFSQMKKQRATVQFSRSVVSDSLWPHGLQHARPPCPSPTPGIYSNSCPLSSDAIQPSHPLWSPSPPAFNLSQH